ncbi:uncharacterized protein PV07_04935 [Cladophialophora immunda]|uniref:Phospholipase/carboxylesterase/thioesterase domain-containing protein n=1 Tax=Cladophialophora immunda TaxID=569365 RepID=A0A0D2CFV5_9EURO|nr:uncharacterized protein PV07_04935 [Cladophialophora immunda]KIW29095.1 hypothetical protein PV07_04935 [Cladophialophora immunda]
MKPPAQHPESYVVLPQGPHKQTVIILHGLGSNGRDFGTALLETALPDGTTLRDALPNAKFVFPTALFRRSTMAKRVRLTQWFDIANLEEPSRRADLQVEGLVETTTFIHNLLQSEMDVVGPANVALGGLSQGCAAALVALLLWPGRDVQAAFGMSGWLPFQDLLVATDQPESEDPTDSVFETAEEEPMSPPERAITELREMLDWKPNQDTAAKIPSTPIFLGHGAEDPKIAIRHGEDAAKALSSLGIQVEWHSYDGLGHWYSAEELADLLRFLRERGFHD